MLIHPDDADFQYSSEAESDRGYARAVGRAYPDRAWILSDRDVWYPNPFYSGPPVRHPEDDSDLYGDPEDAAMPDIVPDPW
jgi:hypothetical protein